MLQAYALKFFLSWGLRHARQVFMCVVDNTAPVTPVTIYL